MNKDIFKSVFYIKNSLLNPILIKNIKTAWDNQYKSVKEINEIQLKDLL